MNARSLVLLAIVEAGLLNGCSFGMFQTAHTQPSGTVSATPGVAYAFDSIDDQAGRGPATNVGAQLGARIGLSRRVDLGIGSFLLTGAKSDVKMNLLDPRSRFAVSPRAGAGYRFGRSVFMLESGAIVSYRSNWLEPYFGLTFANHWIEPDAPDGHLPSSLATRAGTGDGLLQANVGLQLIAANSVGVLAEFGRWFPLNNDPGDFYRFLPTSIAGLALRVGRVRP